MILISHPAVCAAARLIYRLYREEFSNRVLLDFDPYGPEPTLPEPESIDEGLFVVNTNWTYDPEAYSDLLSNNKAAAYYGRKEGIASIHRGSAVGLYHVGVGVIAIGTVTSACCRAIHDDVPDAEFFVQCHFDYKVDPKAEPDRAVKAWEINERFKTGHRFRQTVFTLPAAYASFIREKFQERTNTR